jgi:hypothetical protein
MNWITVPISLQNQYAGSFRIVRVGLDGFRPGDSFNQIFDRDPVGYEFIVPVSRYTDPSRPDKSPTTLRISLTTKY